MTRKSGDIILIFHIGIMSPGYDLVRFHFNYLFCWASFFRGTHPHPHGTLSSTIFTGMHPHSQGSFFSSFNGLHPQPQKPLGTFCSVISITSFIVKYLRNGLTKLLKKRFLFCLYFADPSPHFVEFFLELNFIFFECLQTGLAQFLLFKSASSFAPT